MYNQNPNGFYPIYTKARTDAPLLFTNFKYNVGFWPEEVVKQVGNLVSYTCESMNWCSVIENTDQYAQSKTLVAIFRL
jgi:hypothetical protein